MAKTKTVVNEDEDLELETGPEDEDLDNEEEVEDEVEEEDELEEETEAASTLKPGAKSVDDPKSKIEVMKSVIGAMASASSDELTKWWKHFQAATEELHSVCRKREL